MRSAPVHQTVALKKRWYTGRAVFETNKDVHLQHPAEKKENVVLMAVFVWKRKRAVQVPSSAKKRVCVALTEKNVRPPTRAVKTLFSARNLGGVPTCPARKIMNSLMVPVFEADLAVESPTNAHKKASVVLKMVHV